MAIGTESLFLLQSVLSRPVSRQIFKIIANNRITEKSSIETSGVDTDAEVKTLKEADLVGEGGEGEKLYVTAKGLKVARELSSLL